MARGSRKRPGSPPPERAAPRKKSQTEVAVYVPPDRGPRDFRGRHTLYTDDIAEEIFERLASGEILQSIIQDDHMPSRRTISRWQDGDCGAPADFVAKFNHAKQLFYDAFADDSFADALNPLVGEERTIKIGQGGATQEVTIKRSDNVARSKLRADVRHRLLAMWDPRYRQAAVREPEGGGEQLTVVVKGGLPARSEPSD